MSPTRGLTRSALHEPVILLKDAGLLQSTLPPITTCTPDSLRRVIMPADRPSGTDQLEEFDSVKKRERLIVANEQPDQLSEIAAINAINAWDLASRSLPTQQEMLEQWIRPDNDTQSAKKTSQRNGESA
jgi:hypothetical protein